MPIYKQNKTKLESVKERKINMKKDLIIYQSKTGSIELKEDVEKETIWATQLDMARIFEVTPQNVTIHLKNIYKDNELDKESTCKESLQVQIEGNRKIKRKVLEYNLDVVIAVGYRINSVMGTKFRQWATKTLRQHITQGFTINKNRIQKNYSKFFKAVEQVRTLLPANNIISSNDVLELVKLFAKTWFSLNAYDKSELPKNGFTQKEVTLVAKDLNNALLKLKEELLDKKEASDLFLNEKQLEIFQGIIGNVFQSFGGKDLYSTVEEKAAHLLYFIVKNHPFTDGNKRSGAFSFIWFLQKTNLLNPAKITPEALTALTLLVAESNPKDKDKIVGLILLLLKK